MKASEYYDIGQYLRECRESLRIPVELAARALNIRAKYIIAIENGELENLPGKAYIRGYIKNYVEYLGLSPDEVLEACESALAHKGQEFFVPETTLRQNLPSPEVVRWALAGLILLYAYWYFAMYDHTPATIVVPSVPERFVQTLDKTPHAAMDWGWQYCLSQDGDVNCFLALRQNQFSSLTNISYDAGFADNNPPPKP
jgi:hypothetical protein